MSDEYLKFLDEMIRIYKEDSLCNSDEILRQRYRDMTTAFEIARAIYNQKIQKTEIDN